MGNSYCKKPSIYNSSAQIMLNEMGYMLLGLHITYEMIVHKKLNS